MEVTAEKIIPITEDVGSTRARIIRFLTASGTAITTIARAVNYSRPTLSLYLAGKYRSDAAELEERLVQYLDQHEKEVFFTPQAPGAESAEEFRFFESRDAKTILGLCQAAQEYHEMGILTGRSGYGKSYALQEYAKLPKVGYMECDATMSVRDLIVEIENAIRIPTVSINNHGYTNHDRIMRIALFFKANPGHLLIVDEADKLMSRHSTDKMDLLRTLFDKSGERGRSSCGIVIAGEPGLDTIITRQIPRYANRTLLGAVLAGLTDGDVRDYLADYDISAEALAELKFRALNSRTGCFRLLERTMRNVQRILEQSDGQREVTLAVIRQASSLMMV